MAGERILVVDDTPLNIELVLEMLAEEGYLVEAVTRGDEAIEALDNFRPDLILLDVRLPDIDGLELTRQLKADPKTAHIPVVAITSHAMRGDDQRAYDAGCDGYLTKPVDTRTFARFIRRYLEPPAEGGSADPASKR